MQSPTMETVKYSGVGSEVGSGVGSGVGLGVGSGLGLGEGDADATGSAVCCGPASAVMRKNKRQPNAATAIVNIRISVNFFAAFITLLRL